MNVANRVLVALFLVLLIAAVAFGLFEPALSLGSLAQGIAALQAFAATSPFLYLLIGLGAIVVAVVLLILELRRPGRLTVLVQHVTGDVVELSTDSVARSLEYHLAQVPGIVQVRPKVLSTGKAVKVILDLETDPTADVAAKSEEVIQLGREIVEGKLGLKLARVSANVRQTSYGRGGTPAGRVKAGTELPLVGRGRTDLDLPRDGGPGSF